MSFETLGSAIINTEFLLKKQLGKLSQDGPNGSLMIEVIQNFRRLVCGALLMGLDVNDFSANLYCSAIKYLESISTLICSRSEEGDVAAMIISQY